MAVGFCRGTTDFDDIFEPYTTGTKNFTSGVYADSAGNDLGHRYAPLSMGSKAADVGYIGSAGVDLSNLWAAKGTVSYALPFNGAHFNVQSTALSGQGNVDAGCSLNMFANGTFTLYTNSTMYGTIQEYGGNWNTYGEPSSNFDIRLTVSTGGVSGFGTEQVSNSAAAFTQMTVNVGMNYNLRQPAVNADASYGTVAVTVEIRRRSTGIVISTTTFTCSAEVRGFG